MLRLSGLFNPGDERPHFNSRVIRTAVLWQEEQLETAYFPPLHKMKTESSINCNATK
jgi:hypothetical protein